jgi:DNA-binding NarL/FixJ family response regulator
MQKILSAEARIVDGKIILHIEMEVSPEVFEFSKVVESGIRFTRREKSALEMVRRELSNKEIADEMNVSLSAVKKHVSSLLAKTGSQNRAEL